MATSVPMAPIAMPIVAAAIAGASLTPSPTMATPAELSRRTRRASTFSWGRRPARNPGGVVRAGPHRGEPRRALAQDAEGLDLLVGQQARPHFVGADLGRDRADGIGMVARQYCDPPDAFVLEVAHGGRDVGLECI